MINKILKSFYYLFLVCITAIALLLVVSALPIAGNIKTMTVLSGSMEPSIHVGSMIVTKPASRSTSLGQANYKVGDVITFGKDTKTQIPTTHRIAEIKTVNGETFYKTKGDANNAKDVREVSQKEVLGKVYFSIPYLGYIINFVKKPMGLLFIIVIPAVIIVYEELKKVWREIKNLYKRKKKEEQTTAMAEANVLDLRYKKEYKQLKQKENNQRFIALVIIIALLNLGFISSGRASSYFSDTETVSGNTFTAGTWGVPPIVPPIEKDECKKDGWQELTDPETGEIFKNQGQCVSYFNHTNNQPIEEENNTSPSSAVLGAEASTTLLQIESAEQEIASSTDTVIDL